MRKEIFQYDECYLVKGRASSNDATNNNTVNEIFSKLDDFHYPKVIPNIQRCKQCNVIYAKSSFLKTMQL